MTQRPRGDATLLAKSREN